MWMRTQIFPHRHRTEKFMVCLLFAGFLIDANAGKQSNYCADNSPRSSRLHWMFIKFVNCCIAFAEEINIILTWHSSLHCTYKISCPAYNLKFLGFLTFYHAYLHYRVSTSRFLLVKLCSGV